MESQSRSDIAIPFPDVAELNLYITAGACRLKIRPGAGEQWVAGTYEDPGGALPLRIEQERGTARVGQAPNWPGALGAAGKPAVFDLMLGKGRPYSLTLELGANEGTADLGGLPLTRLTIKYGAGKQSIDFSAANPELMTALSVAAGAAAVEMHGLAHANFSEMQVEGGAASFVLDFSGQLRRPGQVRISTGMASVDVHVPSDTPARITTDTVMGSVDVGDGFMKKEGAYWTEAALAGHSPELLMKANVTMGAIKIRTTGSAGG
jgi:hypothetical protein